MSDIAARLRDLSKNRYAGPNELWLDPTGNQAIVSEGTIELRDGVILYTWSYEGQKKEGRIELTEDGILWRDTWHQPESMKLQRYDQLGALFAAKGTYRAGDGPDWGWHIILSHRPSGELVLQMTNVTHWGEEGRAVRLVGL